MVDVKLAEAVGIIKEGQMSQREASEGYKIPRSTLQNKLNNLHTKLPDSQTVLTVDEERK